MILTAIHEENGLYIFSIKMRNANGEFEPVRMWSYRTFSQAMANREKILNTKFPVALEAPKAA